MNGESIHEASIVLPATARTYKEHVAFLFRIDRRKEVGLAVLAVMQIAVVCEHVIDAERNVSVRLPQDGRSLAVHEVHEFDTHTECDGSRIACATSCPSVASETHFSRVASDMISRVRR